MGRLLLKRCSSAIMRAAADRGGRPLAFHRRRLAPLVALAAILLGILPGTSLSGIAAPSRQRAGAGPVPTYTPVPFATQTYRAGQERLRSRIAGSIWNGAVPVGLTVDELQKRDAL